LQRLNAARSRWQKGNSNSFQAQFDCMYGVAGAQGGCDPAQIANQNLILGFMCATGVAWCEGTGWEDEFAAMTEQSVLSGLVGMDGGGGSRDAAVTEFGSEAVDDFNDVSIVSSGCGESFTSGTGVLLASGKAIPISSLKPGDKVLATNTTTGKTSPETVYAVEVNHDTDLYNLRVKTSHGITVIHTTSNHLFWVPYLDYGWIPAKYLKSGMHLKTPDGQSAVVVGGSVPAVHDGWMWDLTVPGNDDHDFYVLPASTDGHHLDYVEAGNMAVLVHNCGPFSQDAMQQAQDYASSASKMEHVIDPAKHNFGDLVKAAGGRSEAMQQIVASLSDGAGLPESGPFEVTRTIQGEAVTIRGAVVNGVPKLGTAFIP
jgi:hypothetical protein